jgi:hypothetical protein
VTAADGNLRWQALPVFPSSCESFVVPIWTNDEAWIFATGWGIARTDESGTKIVRFPRTGLRREQDPPEIAYLAALDDRGERALFARQGEPPSILENGAVRPCGGPGAERLQGAVSLGGGRLLVLADDGGRVGLFRANVDGDTMTRGDPVPLPPAKRVEWRSALFAASAEDERRRKEEAHIAAGSFDPSSLGFVGRGGTARLVDGRHGIGVTSTYAGHVAVLDKATLSARFAVRLPSLPTPPGQFDIFLLPLAKGAFVTLVANFRQTELVLLDDAGEVVAHRDEIGDRPLWGAVHGPILGRKGVVLQGLSEDETWSIAVPSLGMSKVDEEAFPIECGEGKTTRIVARASLRELRPHNWKLVRTVLGHIERHATLPTPDFRPTEAPPLPAGPERATGSPSLALQAQGSWSAGSGKDLELAFVLANTGGSLKGAYVEVGGPAVASIEGLEVACEGHRARLSEAGPTLRAELPALCMDPAFLRLPKGTPQPPVVPPMRLVVRVRGKKAGSGLLTVRVGPLGAKGYAGSALQGRVLTIS